MKCLNQCVDSCTFPMDAKLAEVVPLYKKADNMTMHNYRPVSILPSLSKVLEKIIHQQLLPFLETILDPRMAAYRKGYSCQHVLLRVVEDWKLALDDRKHMAAMLMDLSKAFDSLPHEAELIIAKLKAYGMKEEGCAFVWAYLSKRKQRVKLSGCASVWMELLKSVPQGSILGPIFFNIFMNDIYATMTRSSLYNYADDNAIAVICDTKQDAIDALSQESELAVDWFKVNMMEANPTKFQAIILRNVDQSTNIPIRDNVVPSAKQVKLLGVTIEFPPACQHHNYAGELALNFEYCSVSHHIDEQSRMSIFRCFVLSNFNYCSLVWNFCGAEYTSKMERIQFKALKFVYNDFNTSYTELLARANLPTLQLHRKREILVDRKYSNLSTKCHHLLCGTYSK